LLYILVDVDVKVKQNVCHIKFAFIGALK